MVPRPVRLLMGALVVWLLVGASCIDRVVSVEIVGGDVELAEGENWQLRADVVATGMATRHVEWSSADPGIVTVTATGVIAGMAPGEAEVTATSVWDRSMSASIVVTVTSASAVSVSVEPASVTLPLVGARSFTATVTGAEDAGVIWSATCGCVSGSGATVVYTAPGSGRVSTCRVRATSVADGGAWGEATVTVEGGLLPSASYVDVSNVCLGVAGRGPRLVSFDVGWPESWRGPSRPPWVAASDNWDAVWVLVKFRVEGGVWRHATLASSGHVAPPGVVVEVPGDRVGAFVYRGDPGYGAFSANGVGLAWDVVADGVPAGAIVEVRPFAIEMVYVPQGSFSLGSGGSREGEFRAGGTASTPFVVSSQSPIALGDGSGQLMWATGMASGAPSGSTNASFPTGYGAFYVMKHGVTQGQYVDFLNTLTQAQADARKYTGSLYRYAIAGSSVGSYATSLPFVAVNYLSWADGAAFADWAGLRPMAELEYEKAARGPLPPVADEFAWGSTSVTQATGLVNEGTITETPTPAGANANYALGNSGPVRVGSFAAPGRSRRDAGAGYYGALELSGNLAERPVTVGNAEGRAFTGTHGDGTLDASGNANVASWPGSTALGAGLRGGSWGTNDFHLRVSDRGNAAFTYASRDVNFGWRGARSAP